MVEAGRGCHRLAEGLCGRLVSGSVAGNTSVEEYPPVLAWALHLHDTITLTSSHYRAALSRLTSHEDVCMSLAFCMTAAPSAQLLLLVRALSRAPPALRVSSRSVGIRGARRVPDRPEGQLGCLHLQGHDVNLQEDFQ